MNFYSVLNVTGPVITHPEVTYFFSSDPKDPPRITYAQREIEVISRTHVKEHYLGRTAGGPDEEWFWEYLKT